MILWLDCDREGEAIAFEVIEVIKKVNKQTRFKRARFSAITYNDIWYAIKNL